MEALRRHAFNDIKTFDQLRQAPVQIETYDFVLWHTLSAIWRCCRLSCRKASIEELHDVVCRSSVIFCSWLVMLTHGLLL